MANRSRDDAQSEEGNNFLGGATRAIFNSGSGRGLASSIDASSTKWAKFAREVEKVTRLLEKAAKYADQIGQVGSGKGGKGSSRLGLAPVNAAGATAVNAGGGGGSSTKSNGQPVPSFGGQPSTSYKIGYAVGTATAGAAQALPFAGPVAAGVATMFPGTSSGVDRQQAIFQTGLATGAIGRDASNFYGKLGLATFGNYTTSVNSDVRSMALAANYGFDPASKSGQSMLGQIGSMSLTTGMSNEQVASAVFSQSTNPVMANRMLMLGINQTSGGVGGGPQSVAQIANQLVKSVYNNPTPEKIRAGLRPGGALDMMLQSYVPDPTMQELVRDAMFKMALNKGNAITNDAATMTKLGLADSMNSPRVAGMRNTSVENKLGERFRESNVRGYTGALDAASNLTEAFVSLTEAIGPVADAFQTMQAFTGTFGQTRPGSAISTTVTGIVNALLSVIGLSEGGPVKGPGTSKSDSIPAMLSNGEFVMNADSVSKYGKEFFEALNAKKYSNGGPVNGSEIANYAASFAGKVGYSGPSDSFADNKRAPGVGAADPTKPETWKNGWGCSEFTNAIFKQYGLNIGGYSVEQYANGTAVSKSDLQPGDVVFFNYHGRNGANNPDHVGIYIGNGQMVEAEGSATGTVIDGVDWEKFIGGRRYLTGSENTRPSVASSPGSPTTGASSNGRSSRIFGGKSGFTGAKLKIGPMGFYSGNQSIMDAIMGGFSSPNLGPILRSAASGSGGLTGSTTPTAVENTSYTGGGGGIDFAKWLYSKGLTGVDLENMWTIGMRESSGQNIGPGNPNFNGVDYGIFQINKAHEDMVKKHGWTMEDLVDPDKNFAIMRELSNNGSNLYSWAVNAQTGELDWREYGGSRDAAVARYSWVPASEKAYYSLRGQSKDALRQAGVPGYSGGAWSIGKDQTANIHQGEMILPANMAEIVRTGVRGAFAGQGGAKNAVTINVTVASGSDADALRLVRRVKDILEEDKMLDSISGIGA